MFPEITIKHIGINAATSVEADRVAQIFSEMMGVETVCGIKSNFSGDLIEVMKGNGRGTYGHIALAVDSIEEAIPCFQSRGISFDAESAGYDENGIMKIIYLEGEYAGFAVHLARK